MQTHTGKMLTQMFNTEQLQQLFRYGVALTTDEHQAHDLLQDAIENCLRKPPNSPAALLAYARTIMRNRFIDNNRHQQRFPQDSYEEEQIAIDMDVRTLEDIAVDENELDHLWCLLEPLEREILFLWAVEEHSTSEIASQLEIPRGTILSRIHRLRKRLQNHSNDLSTGSRL